MKITGTTLAASLALLSLAIPVRPVLAQTSVSYSWQQIKLGAAGFVTGMEIHPVTKSLKYIRTDVGGVYRWQSWGTWLPVTEALCAEGYGSIESLALDPKNAQKLYVAATNPDEEATTSRIYRSSDQGATWSYTTLPTPMAGNGSWRNGGERLAVDPNKGSILLFGSRKGGLYRSTNSGVNWRSLALPSSGTSGIGVTFVAFDKRTKKSDGSTAIVYVGVAGVGVYRSGNGGSSWQLLTSGPSPASEFVPLRAAIDSNGKVFVTWSRGSDYEVPTAGAITRYSGSGTAWTTITPKKNGVVQSGIGYGGISVDPTSPLKLVAAEWRFRSGCRFFRSVDGGSNWTEIEMNPTNSEPWWPSYAFATGPAAVVIDPEDVSKTWMTDGFSAWRTDDNRWDGQYWYGYSNGIEELVPTYLARPRGTSGDRVLLGVMDMVGFTTTDYSAAPPKWDGQAFGNVTSLDWPEGDPSRVYRVVGDKQYNVWARVSFDGGQTWGQPWNVVNLPAGEGAGRLVASSGASDNLVYLPATRWNAQGQVVSKPYYSWDRGGSWSRSTIDAGLDLTRDIYNINQPLVADRKLNYTFYLYGNNGKFYRSTNGGQSFDVRSEYWQTGLPWNFKHCLKAAPHRGGEIWMSFTSDRPNSASDKGLFRSLDGGATWSRIAQIDDALAFAFGKSASGRADTSTVYVYGWKGGVVGLWRSTNVAGLSGTASGATWVQINADRPLPRPVWAGLEADRDTFGVVYFGGSGRGYFVGRPQ
jgi:hypothetical protein